MNPNAPSKTQRRLRDLVGLVLLVLFLPIIGPAVLLGVASYFIYASMVHIAIWLVWCTRGKFILFVYSDSPIWRDHILSDLLPRIRDHSVVLNWSERRNWRQHFSLPVMAFRAFGGPTRSKGFAREFNPMAVVFRPFRIGKAFRFWKAFKDYKHGTAEPLEKMESEFLTLVDSILARKAV